MKQIFVGPYNQQMLFTAIKKTTRPTHIALISVWALLFLIPYAFSNKIFGASDSEYSNVVLVGTNSGSGSAVYIGNNNLITAAHVIEGMTLNDFCEIEFQNPNDTESRGIQAEAQLVAMGNYTGDQPDQDFALLHIVTLDASKFAKASALGVSASVNVADNIKVEGFPGGTYSYTEGVVSSIKGAEHPDLFDVSAGAWPGNSGGALFNRSNQLIGIVILKGSIKVNEGKTYALKIDKIKRELQAKGFQL